MPYAITIRINPDVAVVEIEGGRLMTWQPWHFDLNYNNELNRAGVLRAETITSDGSLIAFADGIQIYNDLAPDVRSELENILVIYTLDLRYSQQRFGLPKTFRGIVDKGGEILKIAASMPRALQPAVWTRTTGEKVVHSSP